MKLFPLFLVSLAAVGIETALTRFFALASWSDYGYWVISIVMVGFAFSGVTLALAKDFLVKRANLMLAALPALLVVSAGIGTCFTILNPFNPLQLQNQVTYLPQLGNIFLYYAALLPFFFLAGLFISLSFVMNAARIGRVYAADLTGAGIGSILILALMYVCPPFRLIPALLPALFLAALFTPKFRAPAIATAGAGLLAAECLLLLGPQASISQYKPLYPPLHTPNAHILAQIFSPRGDYMLLDDFTERVNTDISNDAGMLATRTRHAASACTATASASRACPTPAPPAPATRPAHSTRCPTPCARTRRCCWPAPPAAFASPKFSRSAPAASSPWNPSPRFTRPSPTASAHPRRRRATRGSQSHPSAPSPRFKPTACST